MGIKDYKSLLDFAIKRSGLGTTMFLPVAYDCKGSMIYVLPGLFFKNNRLNTEVDINSDMYFSR